MRTGVIMEIKDGRATIMKNGGKFITVKAKREWKKGEIIGLKEKTVNCWAFCTAAACLLFICISSVIGYRSYFNETSIISLDVNPSIEIKANRFDRVISAFAYNEEGTQIINQANLKNQKLGDAVENLLAGGLSEYVHIDSIVTLTVQNNDKQKGENLLEQLQKLADKAISGYEQSASVEAYEVDKDTVMNAHSHHVTAGKYMVLLELQEFMPQLVMEEYSGCSINEIKQQIKDCSSAHGKGRDGHVEGESHQEGVNGSEHSGGHGEGHNYEQEADLEERGLSGEDNRGSNENGGGHRKRKHGQGHGSQ